MSTSSPQPDIALLESLPLFAGLDSAQLARVQPLARIESVQAQAQLLRQGQMAHDLHVVIGGKFNLCLELGGQRQQCVLTVSFGEIIGWSAMLDQPTWLTSASAIKPSSVLILPGDKLRALCESDHEIGYHVMKNLFAAVAARLQDTRLQLIDMYANA